MPRHESRKREALKVLEGLASSYAQHVGRAESTIVRWATGSGDTLDRLRNGKAITLDRLERIEHWFAMNWPEDLEWPSDISRPQIFKEVSQ